MKAIKYLYDIMAATEAIEDFMVDIKNFKDYALDEKTQSAVERKLIIIGEAINKLSKLDDSPLISKTPDIVAFRNILVHAYDQISDRMVWAILQKELPDLRKEIDKLIKN
ncbi:MAG: HepT-like ribonuclease domain-containing protein [Leeuwenhoekiella sp.]